MFEKYVAKWWFLACGIAIIVEIAYGVRLVGWVISSGLPIIFVCMIIDARREAKQHVDEILREAEIVVERSRHPYGFTDLSE